MDNRIAIVVEEGDTLAKIAAFYTGDEANWPAIARANHIYENSAVDPAIRPGDRIHIPQ